MIVHYLPLAYQDIHCFSGKSRSLTNQGIHGKPNFTLRKTNHELTRENSWFEVSAQI